MVPPSRQLCKKFNKKQLNILKELSKYIIKNQEEVIRINEKIIQFYNFKYTILNIFQN